MLVPAQHVIVARCRLAGRIALGHANVFPRVFGLLGGVTILGAVAVPTLERGCRYRTAQVPGRPNHFSLLVARSPGRGGPPLAYFRSAFLRADAGAVCSPEAAREPADPGNR